MPLPLNQFMHGVAAEHTNREAWPSQFDVLAKKAEIRALLKWLAARKGHAFDSPAGKNPLSNFLYGLCAAPVERMGDGFQQPGQRKEQPCSHTTTRSPGPLTALRANIE